MTQFRQNMVRNTFKNDHDKKAIFKSLRDMEMRIDHTAQGLSKIMATCCDTQAMVVKDIKPDVKETRAHLNLVATSLDSLAVDFNKNAGAIQEKLLNVQETTDLTQFAPIKVTLERMQEALMKVQGLEGKLENTKVQLVDIMKSCEGAKIPQGNVRKKDEEIPGKLRKLEAQPASSRETLENILATLTSIQIQVASMAASHIPRPVARQPKVPSIRVEKSMRSPAPKASASRKDPRREEKGKGYKDNPARSSSAVKSKVELIETGEFGEQGNSK